MHGRVEPPARLERGELFALLGLEILARNVILTGEVGEIDVSELVDRANGKLRLHGRAELVHEHDVEVGAEAIGHDSRQRHSTTRDSEDKRVLAGKGSKSLRQAFGSVLAIAKCHTTCHDKQWPFPATVRVFGEPAGFSTAPTRRAGRTAANGWRIAGTAVASFTAVGLVMCVRSWIVRAATVALIGLSTMSLVVAQPPQTMVGGTFEHTVVRGETWQSLGSRFGIEPALLAILNQRPLGRPLKVGESLWIDNRHLVPAAPDSGIVINIPQRMLFLKANGHVVGSYPVALGRPSWPTFVGPFTVDAAEVDPVWDVPPSIQEELRRAGKKVLTRVPPGPSNPLGKYWLGLSEPNFGIHGTIAPRSIYHFETHGCIRLHPEDIADLWPRVSVGTAGEIVYEPLLLAVMPEGTILLEAHRDVYRQHPHDPEDTVRMRAQHLGVEERIDWDAVRSALAAREGTPRDVTRKRLTSSLRPSSAVTMSNANGSATSHCASVMNAVPNTTCLHGV